MGARAVESSPLLHCAQTDWRVLRHVLAHRMEVSLHIV